MDGNSIILKIKEKGLYVNIPGLPASRTPVDLDISKCDLSLVLSYLRSNGIKGFQIISKSDSGERILKHTDLIKKKDDTPKTEPDKKLEKRLDHLEEMISSLLTKDPNEKIKNKLDFLEVLIKNIKVSEQVVESKPSKKKEPEIEELDDFIPEIDVTGLSMKGDFHENVVEQDKENLDNSVDLLSKLLNGGGKKWEKK